MSPAAVWVVIRPTAAVIGSDFIFYQPNPRRVGRNGTVNVARTGQTTNTREESEQKDNNNKRDKSE